MGEIIVTLFFAVVVAVLWIACDHEHVDDDLDI